MSLTPTLPPMVVVPIVTGEAQAGVGVGVRQVPPLIYCRLLAPPVAAVKP